jgi:hypothetical protein
MTPSTIHHNLMSSLNQMPPNSSSLLPTRNGIKQCAAFTEQPSTVAFPTSIAWIDNKKTHISTSKAAPHPLTSCSGPTDLLSRSFACEPIADRNVALIHCIATKKVSYHVFSYLYAAKYRTTDLFPNPSLVSTSKNDTSNDARVTLVAWDLQIFSLMINNYDGINVLLRLIA